MAVVVMSRPVEDEQRAKCRFCGPDGPWINPAKQLSLCDKHWLGHCQQVDRAERAYIASVLEYAKETGDEAATRYAALLDNKRRAFNQGKPFVYASPDEEYRQANFDPEPFIEWRRKRREERDAG